MKKIIINESVIKKVLIILITIFFFSGCVSLTKELPSYKTYSLEYEKDDTKLEYINKTIQVFEPKTLDSINSRAISYSKDKFLSEKYALSRWSDKPSKMIQRTMASYLSGKNSYKYISTSNIKIKSDFRLVSELIDFKHTFTKNSSYADFSIRIFLINNKTNEVFFKSFVYNKKAITNNAEGLVNAINYINNKFLYDLNNFIHKKLKN